MNKKQILATLLAMSMFLVASWAQAQEGSNTTNSEVSPVVSPTPVREQDRLKTEVRDIRTEVKENVRDTIDEVRGNVQERTDQAREALRVNQERLRVEAREKIDAVKERGEEAREMIDQKREELKTRIDQKREELKERLEQVRDERKREAVERIDQQMDALNERLLNHYTDILKRLEGVLENLQEKASDFEARGVDVTPVREAIASATAAIDRAYAAIEAQSGKTYTIEVTTEDNLRNDVGGARQQLHDDLSVVVAALRNAHSAVKNVATVLAQQVRIAAANNGGDASPTSTPEATENSEE
ncbi:MAG: hypothetical protein WD898_01750 [Candidatus Paceibacterota bacterium]